MRLSGSASQLHRALKELKEHWELTKEDWNDDASQEFEENRLLPLEMETAATVAAINRLDQAINQANNQCS